jgi:hypothetical protein
VQQGLGREDPRTVHTPPGSDARRQGPCAPWSAAKKAGISPGRPRGREVASCWTYVFSSPPS